MHYHIILFDLDGTLTDPKIGIINSILFALNKLGIIEKNPEKLVTHIGPPLQELFKNLYRLDHEKTWKAIEYYREYFSEKGMYENIIYPGIRELLLSLKNDKKLMYVATSKPTIFSEQIIKHFNLDSYFKKVVGANLDNSKSTKTQIIAEIMNENPYLPKNSYVIIGDREHDIYAAKENGIDSIGVLYGYGSKQEITHAKPTNIAISVKDVEKFLS